MKNSDRISSIKAYLLIVFILLLLFWLFSHKSSDTNGEIGRSQKYPTDSASSLWVVVNKGQVLPNDYVPPSLTAPKVSLRLDSFAPEMQMRSDAAKALETLVRAAALDGQQLTLASGYRSYSDQVSLYNFYVENDGQDNADTYSARPGHSEHQTGLAVDMEASNKQCELKQCFGEMAEGKWLAANSFKYGYIIRYQAGKDQLTGYEYEPWHIRYVGSDLANKLHKSGSTMEQYLKLPIYNNYPSTIKTLRN